MVDWKALGLFGVVISQIVGSVGAGMGVAYLLVTKAGAPSLSYGIGAIVGLIHAFYQIARISKKSRNS